MNTEIYYYTVNHLEQNSSVLNHNNIHSTNHISAPLFSINQNNQNNQYIQSGYMYSVNNSFINNDTNNITTLSTFVTPNGVLVCNLYYTTNNKYLTGTITATPTFSSGIYANQTVTIEVNGYDNGIRQLTISFF